MFFCRDLNLIGADQNNLQNIEISFSIPIFHIYKIQNH